MAGTNSNNLVNQAVSHSGEVDSLLIERFNGQVHAAYNKGENLLSNFSVMTVHGTNMVSNKYIGGTTLQKLVAGQEVEAHGTTFDKNSFVIDTVIIARAAENILARVQGDIEVQSRLAEEQAVSMKSLEDQMVIQQLTTGAMTGGNYNGFKVEGGTRRLPNHGAAIKVGVKKTQLADPYVFMSALEHALNGLIAQKVPLTGLRILLPITEFSLLSNYGMIKANSISQAVSGFSMSGLTGTLTAYGIPVVGSAEFTQLLASAPQAAGNHSLLSSDDNGNRYDMTAEHQKVRALIYGKHALMCGKSIDLQSDIFFNKDRKTWFIDTWMSQGCIPDRYDNLAMIFDNGTGATQPEVIAMAKAKAMLTKADISA